MAKDLRGLNRTSALSPSARTLALFLLVAFPSLLYVVFIAGITASLTDLLTSTGPSTFSTHGGARLSLRLPAISFAQHAQLNSRSKKHDKVDEGKPWIENISWEPRAFIYHNFLSKEEGEHLINLGKPYLKKSTVINSTTGKGLESRVRTSYGAFLKRGHDEIVSRIEKRIADFTFIPVEHGESIQILHYEVGQKYDPHLDYFHDNFNPKHGGQRQATLLMYLSDVETGGETVFPLVKVNSTLVKDWDALSECGKKGMAVRPKAGDALLFWSMRFDASMDPTSLHGGCPVISGEKWSATKWMRVYPRS